MFCGQTWATLVSNKEAQERGPCAENGWICQVLNQFTAKHSKAKVYLGLLTTYPASREAFKRCSSSVPKWQEFRKNVKFFSIFPGNVGAEIIPKDSNIRKL